MNEVRLLHFEDYPKSSENRLLLMRIRRKLQGHDVFIRTCVTVEEVETDLIAAKYDIVLLDVMVRAPANMVWRAQELEVSHLLTGLAILERCRLGEYGEHYTGCPIYMRTARTERFVERLSHRLGATAFFKAGGGDSDLLEEILARANE